MKKKIKKPKLRIPLPLKPPKVESSKSKYKRHKKHKKKIEE